ncbi:hypothetical protein LTR62_004836 [Meristemomyces frigidus]|uniref:Heme haloperoxidase family profile domain-containing protein n=1 Tax=Meristemomyces frigidus TaxID=1508187 RepID=A0AAN7YFT4_9PEZI|nr:hypothetical protein LTR62_004836 [Meristemomyces frigidus]
MKSTFVSAALVASTAAFPHLAVEKKGVPAGSAHKRVLERATQPQGGAAGVPAPLLPPVFDAASQRIDVNGSHAFVAPGAGDARGPCPGLNAMANHNYLPHNGVATITEFIAATTSVFGMGVDLATFLATYGAILDGDGTSWSIAGGSHVGIGGSHGNYETDSSPTRGDLDQYGSNSDLVLSQFKTLYDMQPDAATANYNIEVLRTFRETRFQESISKNPYFSYQPVAGMLVSQAAFTFIYRFMANHSAEAPEGILNKDVLKSFFSITGDDDNLKWTPGHEQIPYNWYRRNTLDAYTIPYYILYFAAENPEFLLVGCNQGEVNTYNTISASTLSNGAYTVAQAAANPTCFATEFAIAELPGLTGLSGSLVNSLTGAITGVTGALGGCQGISKVNTSALTACPGFALYGGPTGPVAKGAVQS